MAATKRSARNILIKGKVKSLTKGAVNTEVIVSPPDGTDLVSVIINISTEAMGLKKGKKVYAIIKAPNIILGIDYKC